MKNIWIIDDDEVFHFILKRQLKRISQVSEIHDFETPIPALKVLREEPDLIPDLIFVDLIMPEMDGWEFLDEFLKVKDSLATIPKIYMISTSINDADIEKAKSMSQIQDYLVKPVSALLLKKVVEAA